MPAQKGDSFLLKITNGDSPETFSTVGGFRTNTLTINDEPVDSTTKASTGRWRVTLDETGLRTMDVSGDGLIEDDTYITNMVTALCGTNTSANYQIVVPGLGTFEGSFHLKSFDASGPQKDNVTFGVSLTSNGAITFTAG